MNLDLICDKNHTSTDASQILTLCSSIIHRADTVGLIYRHEAFATGVRPEDDLVGKVKILPAGWLAASINDHGRLAGIYRSLSKHFNAQLS